MAVVLSVVSLICLLGPPKHKTSLPAHPWYIPWWPVPGVLPVVSVAGVLPVVLVAGVLPLVVVAGLVMVMVIVRVAAIGHRSRQGDVVKKGCRRVSKSAHG